MRESIFETDFDLIIAFRLYVDLSTLEIYCVLLIRIVRKIAIRIMTIIYLVYLSRNYEIHEIFVVSSEEHLELSSILTNFIELLVLLLILIHDEREKRYASSLNTSLESII